MRERGRGEIALLRVAMLIAAIISISGTGEMSDNGAGCAKKRRARLRSARYAFIQPREREREREHFFCFSRSFLEVARKKLFIFSIAPQAIVK